MLTYGNINKYICMGCKRLKLSFRRDTTKDADNLKLKAEEEEEETLQHIP
jgi:hypothetical protein